MSPAEKSPTLNEKGEVDLLQPWSDLDPYPQRPPLFLPRCSKPTLAIWSERLAKGLYQKNIPMAVRLKPVVHVSQIQAFYQLSHPGPLAGFITNDLLQWL